MMVGVLKGLMVWAGSLLVSAAGLVGCMSCHLQNLKSLGDLFGVIYWLRRAYGSSALSWAHTSAIWAVRLGQLVKEKRMQRLHTYLLIPY